MKGQSKSSTSQLLLSYSTQSPWLNGCSQHPQILALFFLGGGDKIGLAPSKSIYTEIYYEKLGSFPWYIKKKRLQICYRRSSPSKQSKQWSSIIEHERINHPNTDYSPALIKTAICNCHLFLQNCVLKDPHERLKAANALDPHQNFFK